MLKLSFLFCMSLLLFSCSSKKKVKDQDISEHISRDYEIRDASSSSRPGWIEDAISWSEQESRDTKNFRYFAFETEPKVNRQIACNLARANVRADIAAEITTFIQKSLAASEEGSASIDANNPKTQAMREFVSNTLAEKVQALVHGAAVIKTHWEKRQFLKSLGSKKDYIGFTCAVLVQMGQDRLKSAIDKASEEIVKTVDDAATKENVKKALEKIDDDFVKARKGEV